MPVLAPLRLLRGPGLLFSAAALGPGAALKASAGGFMLPFSGIAAFEALSRSPGLRGALPGTPGETIHENQNWAKNKSKPPLIKIKNHPPRSTIESGCQTPCHVVTQVDVSPTQRLRAEPDAIGAGRRESYIHEYFKPS